MLFFRRAASIPALLYPVSYWYNMVLRTGNRRYQTESWAKIGMYFIKPFRHLRVAVVCWSVSPISGH